MHHLTIDVLHVASPLVAWHCRPCGRQQAFRSTGAFRANANGRRVDVWLLYRCVACDDTRKLAVAERTDVDRLAPGLLAAAEANGAATARACARDVGLLRAASARVVAEEAWRLAPAPPPLLGRAEPLELSLRMDEPLLLALRGPIAAALGTSSSGLGRLVDAGRVKVHGDPPLRRIRMWRSAAVTLLPA